MNKMVNAPRGRPIIVERGGITVTRVGVNLGAEISGVDLRKPLSDEQFGIIEDALVENEVIIFRNQEITSDNLIDFGCSATQTVLCMTLKANAGSSPIRLLPVSRFGFALPPRWR